MPIKGMTLLEVLIAIFVIGIGILSIARLMTHNIATIAKVHNQTTATTLAREWMEMINNVRDTNTLLWYERNCAERSTEQDIQNLNNQSTEVTTLCKSFFWTGDGSHYVYTIDGGLNPDTAQITMKKINNTDLFSGGLLYKKWLIVNGVTISWYTHDMQDAQASDFARYIEFTGMAWLPDNTALSSSDINPVRSIVLYKNGNKTGEVILESFIANKE